MTQFQAMALSMVSEATAAGGAALAWRLAPVRAGSAAVAGTALTHWPLWQIYGAVAAALGYWPALLALEGVVVLVEAVVYRLLLRSGWGAALLLSLAANACSTALGLLIYRLT
jgi:hypothetical protein